MSSEPVATEPCAGCGAHVYWMRREFSREYAQVDAQPSARGTVILDLGAQLYRTPPAQGRVYPLYALHALTCPLTATWRGETGAPASATVEATAIEAETIEEGA
jgi:hypothetical protein